jgi:hypothetical protein
VARILQKVPIHDQPGNLTLPGGLTVYVRSDQLIVWVSITPSGLAHFPSSATRFPVVLDTGFNHTLLMAERHLEDWAALKVKDLTWIDVLTADGQAIPLRDADVWIHPNRPHSRESIPDASPFRLELPEGIGVWPAAIAGARRLPLLGSRALRRGGLHLHVNGRAGWFSMSSNRWLWFLS